MDTNKLNKERLMSVKRNPVKPIISHFIDVKANNEFLVNIHLFSDVVNNERHFHFYIMRDKKEEFNVEDRKNKRKIKKSCVSIFCK